LLWNNPRYYLLYWGNSSMRTHRSFQMESFLSRANPRLIKQYRDDFLENYNGTATKERERLARAKFGGKATDYSDVMVDIGASGTGFSRQLEAPLKCVNDFSTPRGRALLCRFARDRGIEVKLGERDVDLGLRLQLDHPDVFRSALDIYHVEQTENWRLFVGPQSTAIDVGEKPIEALTSDFGKLMVEQGVSKKCVATVHPQSERTVIRLAHEEHVVALQKFNRNQVVVDWHSPVRHAMVSYRQNTGVLKIKVYRNDWELARGLVAAIGRHLFGGAGHFVNAKGVVAFNLDALRELPSLQTDPRDRIEAIRIVELTFQQVGAPDAQATFRAARTEPLYSLLRQFAPSPEAISINAACLQFKFPGERMEGQRTIRLWGTNSSDVGEDDYDRVIEKYLSRWGIIDVPEPPEEDLVPDREARRASVGMDQPEGMLRRLDL